jgi:hypothetical protein
MMIFAVSLGEAGRKLVPSCGLISAEAILRNGMAGLCFNLDEAGGGYNASSSDGKPEMQRFAIGRTKETGKNDLSALE